MGTTDEDIRHILTHVHTIAVVGLSANAERPSHYVSSFLQEKGYRIIGVNPGLAGQELFGETVYGRLSDIPFEVDMVDIFRRSEDVPPIVDEALARFPRLVAIWMQIGVCNPGAAETARAAGVKVVQNRCPKVEYPRLFG